MTKPSASASRNRKAVPAYKDANRPPARRVKDLLSRMTLEEIRATAGHSKN